MHILTRRAAILGGLTALCAPRIIRTPGILMPIRSRYLNIPPDEMRRLIAAVRSVMPQLIAQQIVAAQPIPSDMLYTLSQALKERYNEQNLVRAKGCFGLPNGVASGSSFSLFIRDL